MNPVAKTSASLHAHLLAILFALFVPVAAWAAAEQHVYTLQTHGLACPFCAYGVEKQLGKVEGVESVSTDIASGTVIITMKEGQNLNEADARGAVERAGFTMQNFMEKEEL
jgi:mercuric ion binding protein